MDSDSPAYVVLEKMLAKIKTSNVDPKWLAGELRSAGIVGPNDEENAGIDGKPDSDKRAALVRAIMGSGNPGAFETFVETLRKQEHLKWLAKELKGTYVYTFSRPSIYGIYNYYTIIHERASIRV